MEEGACLDCGANLYEEAHGEGCPSSGVMARIWFENRGVRDGIIRGEVEYAIKLRPVRPGYYEVVHGEVARPTCTGVAVRVEECSELPYNSSLAPAVISKSGFKSMEEWWQDVQGAPRARLKPGQKAYLIRLRLIR